MIEIHRDPQGDRYAAVTEVRRCDPLAPLSLRDIQLTVDEMLGR